MPSLCLYNQGEKYLSTSECLTTYARGEFLPFYLATFQQVQSILQPK